MKQLERSRTVRAIATVLVMVLLAGRAAAGVCSLAAQATASGHSTLPAAAPAADAGHHHGHAGDSGSVPAGHEDGGADRSCSMAITCGAQALAGPRVALSAALPSDAAHTSATPVSAYTSPTLFGVTPPPRA